MTNPNFESILDKDISEVNYMGAVPTKSDSNLYTLLNPKVHFFSKTVDQLVFTTTENETVESITIFFQEEEIDMSFYHVISAEYGYTKEIMVFDEILHDGPIKENQGRELFTSTVQEKIVSLKRGNINDDLVNYVVWSKKNYRIALYFDNAKNKMFVQFTKATDK